MEKTLNIIVGNRIVVASKVHDYVQFIFINGDILNVYNNWESPGDLLHSIEKFAGQEIGGLKYSEDALEISTSSGFAFCVDLRDGAFNGPEVLELIPKNGQRIVWS